VRNVAFIVVLLWVGGYCAAKTIYVDVNGPNNPGTGSYNDPFRKIQDAIDSADTDDTVEVQLGVYTGQDNYDLDPNGLAITIRSIAPGDPNVVAKTIIDANGLGGCFRFDSGEDANCVVTGFTLRNGVMVGFGGGIYCNGSSPTISNCVIIKNTATQDGGGIYCESSQLRLVNCIIAANQAGVGGAGGGIKCLLSTPFISNCTISGNSAVYSGGGIYCFASTPTIANSIIWGNDPNQIYATNGEPVITYSNVQDGWSGTGNIDTEPCFVAFDLSGNPDAWDFHLQSLYGRWDPNSESWLSDSNTSSCIDAGDPNFNWSGEPWPNGRRINMGAFGGTNQASKNGNIADFDIDGAVDFIDFAEFSSQWLLEKLSADVAAEGSDGLVNFLDWAVFAAAWQSTQSSPRWNPGCDISPTDSDGIVDVSDMAVFMGQWLQFGAYSADIGPNEGDGIVNMLDFAIFAENWLWQR